MSKGIVLGVVLGALLLIAWPRAEARSTTTGGPGEFSSMARQRDELSREHKALVKQPDAHAFWENYWQRRVEYAERMLTISHTSEAASHWLGKVRSLERQLEIARQKAKAAGEKDAGK